MTPQEIFDKVWDHLNRQGRPSLRTPFGGCNYRGHDGAACAVGCLIDDQTAKIWDDMSNASFENVLEKFENVPDYMRDNEKLLVEFQMVHDNSRRDNWLTDCRDRMTRIAKRYNLTVPPIPQ